MRSKSLIVERECVNAHPNLNTFVTSLPSACLCLRILIVCQYTVLYLRVLPERVPP